MKMRRISNSRHWAVGMLAVGCLFGASACESTPPQNGTGALAEASRLYQQRDYAAAYAASARIAADARAQKHVDGAYLAGSSAYHMGQLERAERHLLVAVRRGDTDLAGDAGAMLGLVYSAQRRYLDAARAFAAAAPKLRGEDRAKAYYYAAIAMQKTGQWSSARTNLVLARSASTDARFKRSIERQMAVTGYTLQVGAYGQQANATRAAHNIAGAAARAGLGRPTLVRSADRGLLLVQVGQFTTYESARRARQSLGVTGAIVVPLAGE